MMLDATTNLEPPLTLDRLYQWHHWLFPDTSLHNQISLILLKVNRLW